MVRLLIVEDEENSRNGLKNILKQIADLEIFTAVNGKEGYEKTLKLAPDIIISDLHMPIWDGLTMIEKLYNKGYLGHIYILTGYAEFEYAQKAMHFHVTDYILKPVVPQQLLSLISQTAKILQRKANQDSPRYCHLITHGDVSILDQKISCCNYTDFFFAVIYMETEHHLPVDVKDNILKKKNHYLLILPDKHYRGVLIGFYSNTVNYSDIAAFSSSLQAHVHLTCIYETSHFICKPDWFALFERLQGAISWTISCQSAFLNYQPFMSEPPGKYPEDIFFKKELQKILCTGEYKKYQKTLYNELIQMQKKRCHPSHILITAVSGLVKLNSKQAYLNAVNLMSSAKSFHEITQILDQYFNADELLSCDDKYSKFIQMAILEISANYKEPITLNSTADKLGITPQYLSRLFMKEISASFNEYLTAYRMEKAKELLHNTNMKINAIAGIIGYPDAKYFCTLFKKETGVTPNQFRGISPNSS